MFHSRVSDLQGKISPNGSLNKLDSLSKIIDAIIPYLFAIALIIVFIYLILGGFTILTSKSDPKAMDAAKGKITYAIVGFVIIFAAFWIVQLFGLATGINFKSVPQ